MATAQPMQVLDGSVRLECRDGYVHAWHGRAAQTAQELEAVLLSLDHMLRISRSTRLLFDSRESGYTPPELQEQLWTWLEQRGLDRVGTLVSSPQLAVSVRMTGLSKKVNIRAFVSESEADAWLKPA
jgi:hypothetical protein